MMKNIAGLSAVALFSLLIISCGKSIKKEEKIKNVIGRYNQAIMLAYKDGKFGPLTEVADGQALSFVDNLYQANINSKGTVLDSEILELRFKKIEPGSGEDEPRVKAVWHEADKRWQEELVFKEDAAETAEKWRYTWVNAKTGKPASPVMTAEYEMEYKLDVRDGRLKIISAKVVKEKTDKNGG